MLGRLTARLLGRLMDWAIEKNGSGTYEGEGSTRWAYTIKADDGSPYLSRMLLPRIRVPLVGEFRPMLHRFHGADGEGFLHNHPWDWSASLILLGSYDEERPDEARGLGPSSPVPVETRTVRFFNTLTADDFHRISRLNGEVWTLFVSGRAVQDWGFLDIATGKFTQWEEFLRSRVRDGRRLVSL